MPDARVQAAIDHWAPRFVQAGVDYNDFIATTSKVERWEDWLDTWCANGDMHADLAREAWEVIEERRAGLSYARNAGIPVLSKYGTGHTQARAPSATCPAN